MPPKTILKSSTLTATSVTSSTTTTHSSTARGANQERFSRLHGMTSAQQQQANFVTNFIENDGVGGDATIANTNTSALPPRRASLPSNVAPAQQQHANSSDSPALAATTTSASASSSAGVKTHSAVAPLAYTTFATFTSGSLTQQQLEARLRQQQVELDNRTDSVNAIQRNFERLSDMYGRDKKRFDESEGQLKRLMEELESLRAERKVFAAVRHEFTFVKEAHEKAMEEVELLKKQLKLDDQEASASASAANNNTMLAKQRGEARRADAVEEAQRMIQSLEARLESTTRRLDASRRQRHDLVQIIFSNYAKKLRQIGSHAAVIIDAMECAVDAHLVVGGGGGGDGVEGGGIAWPTGEATAAELNSTGEALKAFLKRGLSASPPTTGHRRASNASSSDATPHHALVPSAAAEGGGSHKYASDSAPLQLPLPELRMIAPTPSRGIGADLGVAFAENKNSNGSSGGGASHIHNTTELGTSGEDGISSSQQLDVSSDFSMSAVGASGAAVAPIAGASHHASMLSAPSAPTLPQQQSSFKRRIQQHRKSVSYVVQTSSVQSSHEGAGVGGSDGKGRGGDPAKKERLGDGSDADGDEDTSNGGTNMENSFAEGEGSFCSPSDDNDQHGTSSRRHRHATHQQHVSVSAGGGGSSSAVIAPLNPAALSEARPWSGASKPPVARELLSLPNDGDAQNTVTDRYGAKTKTVSTTSHRSSSKERDVNNRDNGTAADHHKKRKSSTRSRSNSREPTTATATTTSKEGGVSSSFSPPEASESPVKGRKRLDLLSSQFDALATALAACETEVLPCIVHYLRNSKGLEKRSTLLHRQETNALHDEIDKLKEAKASLEAEAQQWRDKHSTLAASLLEERNQFKKQVLELEERAKVLASDLARMRSAEGDAARLSDEAAHWKGRAEAKAGECDAASVELKSVKSALEAAEGNATKLTHTNTSLASELEEAAQQANALTSRLDQQRLVTTTLEENVADLKKRLAAATTAAQSSSNASMASLQSQIDALTQSLKASETAIQQLRKEMSDAVAVEKALANEKLAAIASSHQSEVAALQSTISTRTAQITALEAENEALRDRAQAAEAHTSALSEEKAALQATVDALQSDLSDNSAALGEKSKALQQANNVLSLEVTTLKQQLLMAKERSEAELGKLKATYEARLADLKASLDDARRRADAAEAKAKEAIAAKNKAEQNALELAASHEMTARQRNEQLQVQQIELTRLTAETKDKLRKVRALQEESMKAIGKLQAAESSCGSSYSCSSCLSIVKSPIVCAPCGHVYCKACLEKENRSKQSPAHGTTPLYCPECDGHTVAATAPSAQLDVLASKFEYRQKVLADLSSLMAQSLGKD